MGQCEIFVSALFLFVGFTCVLTQDEPIHFEDISPLPTVFESKELPRDENGTFLPRYMASIGNGHVATTINTPTVYMNGLYNGHRGESHRARIPSRNNIRVVLDDRQVANHSFALDVGKGVFVESFILDDYQVEVRTFAHRVIHKVIVTQIKATTIGSASNLNLKFEQDVGPPSSDINFSTPEIYKNSFGILAESQCGQTNYVEDAKYQKEFPQACVIYSIVPAEAVIMRNTTYTFFASYDFDLETAAEDWDTVGEMLMDGMEEELYNEHVEAWEEVWKEGHIEIGENLPLAKIVNGAFYYILSSLPVTTTTNSKMRQFYGLSPGGLAYGDLLKDYQGHSFWDTETWMYPGILYFFPQQAREILNYRRKVVPAAKDRAKEMTQKGARFPWEGAVTGREVTPDCCPETRDLQIHNTGDIAYAIRQYIALTRDLQWLQLKEDEYQEYPVSGCEMIRDIAEFWASRATYDNKTALHEINKVMPPDEDAGVLVEGGVDNNGFTNIVAGYSIFFAKYASCLCGTESMDPIPDSWLEIAKSLSLLYNSTLDYHPEYEGYEQGTLIKQADVVLMGFPLMYNMSESTRRNDLHIYENVTREDGPAMTWAMHTIGFLELDEVDKAAQLFSRSYEWYVRQPYKVWTEAKPPTLGAVNFITGMGGLLQSVITGYGGYRLHVDEIEFYKPRLPPNTTSLRLTGLNYLNNSFDVLINETNIEFKLTSASTNALTLMHDGDTYPLNDTGVVLSRTAAFRAFIRSTVGTQCPLPLDQIGVPLEDTVEPTTTTTTTTTTTITTTTTPTPGTGVKHLISVSLLLMLTISPFLVSF